MLLRAGMRAVIRAQLVIFKGLSAQRARKRDDLVWCRIVGIYFFAIGSLLLQVILAQSNLLDLAEGGLLG